MDIEELSVLVTGGASGLGAATVRYVVAAGGYALIADRDIAAGEALAKELGPRARFSACDVTDPHQIQAAIDAAKSIAPLAGLVNCAGIVKASRTVSKNGSAHPLDTFLQVIQVNLVGSFNAIRLVAQAMASSTPQASGERGVIINTASVAAFDGQIGQAAYSASKGGIVGMTLPIARDLAKLGIRVVTIAPGIFSTPMLEAMPEAVRESLGKQVPFPQRLGHPSEYAKLVGHIFSNVMLNGETIRLDGAIRMAPE